MTDTPRFDLTADTEDRITRSDVMPKIHRAIANVRAEMPAIAKAGSMTLGTNTVPFTRMEDIRKALNPLLEKYDVLYYPIFVDSTNETQVADYAWSQGSETVPPRELKDGKIPQTRFRVQVVYDHQFVLALDGSSIVVRTMGEAYDTNSDKATGKATTAAIKRAFVEVFAIVDGKEADEDDTRGQGRDTVDPEPQDRGAQLRTSAETPRSGPRSGPARSVSTDPKQNLQKMAEEQRANPATGEVPSDPPADRLGAAKARVAAANSQLGLSRDIVNQIAKDELGLGEREGENGWITMPTKVEKLADELEKRAKDGGGLQQFAPKGGE